MPLLFETGAYLLTRPRVLVKCDPETQVCFPFPHSAPNLPNPDVQIWESTVKVIF